ncbi:NDR1/HIN1-like protein [Thermoflexibacter ruber]|uniref:Late embryogenesis abundant protein n=1 Tax=Thermoflexibacter ruber TaxID=1003 RepID=A0A1I2DUV0_9BACT|nr:LEA type 2 family protein [Thermoflexibacter ruber]SFE84011.1 Late embryogenesis abundant protein [Thermoflexibacter ruber]
MKKYFILACGLLVILPACQTLQMMQNFAKCEFRLAQLSNINALGIDMTGKRSFSDFSLLDAGKVVQALAGNQFLLNFVANVEVRNPNAEPAGLNRMDWILMVDNKEVLNGTLNQAVNVPANNGTTIMPLNLSIDLKKIFANQSRDETLSLAFDLAQQGNNTTRLMLRVRPYINIGGAELAYPGYLNIKKDF